MTTETFLQSNQLDTTRVWPESQEVPQLAGGSFRLWSLWEMERFYGEALLAVVKLVTDLSMLMDAQNLPRIGPDARLTQRTVRPLKEQFENTPYLEFLEFIGLNLSAEYCDELEKLLSLEEGIKLTDLGAKANALLDTMKRELGSCYLLHLNPKEENKYVDKFPFGENVTERFPLATNDIEEASKCLALHRFTASVFHSMRAVEIGLKALFKAVGAEEFAGKPYPSWHDFINKIRQAIKNKPGMSPEENQFYTDIVTLIEGFKLSWRNPTMHVDRIYTDEQAEDVFNAARSLMRRLAERIAE